TAFTQPKPGLKGKLAFHTQKQLLRLKEKGTIYDASIGTEEETIAIAKKIIQNHPIKTLICTGAPFNWLYLGARLKKEFPQLKYLADYRDPWLTAKNYGMPQLNDKQRTHETAKQQEVLDVADFVSSPYEGLTNKTLSESATEPFSQPLVIPHFFDPNSLPPLVPQMENGTFTIVYGGACYMGSKTYLEGLKKAIAELKGLRPDLHRILRIKIYSSDYDQFTSIFGASDQVMIGKNIGEKLFHEINASSASMILLADHNKDFQTTKFWEFVSRRKPICYIGPAGLSQSVLENNNWGMGISTGQDLISFMEKKDWNRSSDFSDHTVDHIAELLENEVL
ncbi:MAG: hypothetical protein AAF193_07560, partial [Bacteroidota bacterium]